MSLFLEEVGEGPGEVFFLELDGEGDGTREGETEVKDFSLAAVLVEGALIGENFRETFTDRTLDLEEVGLGGILDRTGSEDGGALTGECFFAV